MKKKIYHKAKPKNFFKKSKIVSLGLMGSGFILIVFALWPILSFDLLVAPRFARMIKPVADSQVLQPSTRGSFSDTFISAARSIVEAQEETPAGTEKDFTKASVWFPKKPAVKIVQQTSGTYSLSIPKLKIKDAVITIGSDDLNKSLIQYGGTAYPGDYGNTVIFGHSVLPFFYNPKDYKTIFSFLPSLNEGDEIFVNYEGITYKYVVENMHVVGPDDVSILEQRFDDSYLSLVTCVPPGTYEKRLWVYSRLQKI